MMHGQLITLEGSEGAGKSTAIAFIKEYLTKKNIQVILTREPGGTALAESIRQLLLHNSQQEIITTEAELLLMFAGRAQHIAHCIKPALQDGKWVISDRYIDASYAYQGGGRGFDNKYIKQLDEWVVGPLYPALTLLLDVPIEVGEARAMYRGTQKDRIEAEQSDFFKRVREAYLVRAKQDPKRIKIIDASLALSAVQAQIQHELDEFLMRIST